MASRRLVLPAALAPEMKLTEGENSNLAHSIFRKFSISSDSSLLSGVNVASDVGRIVWEEFRPGVVVAVDVDGAGGAAIPLLEGRSSDRTLAYVCRGFVCDQPVSNADDLRSNLR